MNLRTDTLAQILNNANVQSSGKYVVYETGCQGLVVSAVLDRLGDGGKSGEHVSDGQPANELLERHELRPLSVKRTVSQLEYVPLARHGTRSGHHHHAQGQQQRGEAGQTSLQRAER